MMLEQRCQFLGQPKTPLWLSVQDGPCAGDHLIESLIELGLDVPAPSTTVSLHNTYSRCRSRGQSEGGLEVISRTLQIWSAIFIRLVRLLTIRYCAQTCPPTRQRLITFISGIQVLGSQPDAYDCGAAMLSDQTTDNSRGAIGNASGSSVHNVREYRFLH